MSAGLGGEIKFPEWWGMSARGQSGKEPLTKASFTQERSLVAAKVRYRGGGAVLTTRERIGDRH